MDYHHLLTTFAAAAATGVFLLILAARIKVSAIVVLLIGGVLVGPEFLGWVVPEHLGTGLNTIVSLAVGLILFEGGLTLDLKGYRQVSGEIWSVLSIGVLITWGASAFFVWLIFGFDPMFSALVASLIIVTGPTVIGPLLRRIRVRNNLHHILHWEGVLIDPIGVFIALFCFEYYISTGSDQGAVFLDFGLRILVGMSLGVAFGVMLSQILKRQWIPEEYQNIFVLACAMLNFMLAGIIVEESGLLSVTIAGLVVAYFDPPPLHRIVTYKVELKDFLIGLLFVLLAANLDLRTFTEYGFKLLLVVAAVMLVVRPLNIFICMSRSALQVKEKLFLSWIAPRGIVAASMASVFAFTLSGMGESNGGFLETFTYSVIAGTVIFQGFTAKTVGRFLGVLEPKPTGWVIVGAHAMGRAVAKFIQNQGENVVLVDTNLREVRQAEREGLTALCEDAMALDPENSIAFYGRGYFLALTPNENLNRLLCQRWEQLLDGATFYRWEEDNLDQDMEERLMVGTSVWRDLDLGRWLTLGNERPSLHTLDMESATYDRPENVLLTVQGGVITPDPPDPDAGPATLLVIDKPAKAPETQLPLRPEWVIFSEETELEPLYSHMLDLLRGDVPRLDRQSLLTQLLEREKEYTSLLGHGISMPHVHAREIEEAILLVARPEQGIACEHTGGDIDLIFMLLSPEEEHTEHLVRISHIARIVGKEADRMTLLEAKTTRDLYEAIAKA